MAGVVMQIFQSILSKLGELIFAFAHNKVSSTNELGLTLKTLQTALKALSARASDVEEQIKSAEQSGRKKRKREVDERLVDVNSIRTEVAELVAHAEPAGYIRRMFGQGNATRLTEQVKNLIEQSRHFGELLLDVGGSSMVRADALKMKEEERQEEVVKRLCSIKRKCDGIRLKMPNTLKRPLIKCAFEPSERRRSAFEEGPDQPQGPQVSFLTNLRALTNLSNLRVPTNLSNLRILFNPDSLSFLPNLRVLTNLRDLRFPAIQMFLMFPLIKHLPYLKEFKALKKLDLPNTGIKELPREVHELLDLKTLSLPPLP